MAVTRETIWQAADELDAEGIKPTLNAVRHRVGSGSFTTISEAMSEWKAHRQAKARVGQEPPPAEIAERANTLAAEIWAVARAAADKALAGERQEMETERTELRAQVADAAELADKLTEETETLRAELDGLRQVQAERNKLADELTELKRKTAAEVHRAMEKATAKDSEAIEARKAERAAIERAGRAEGQVQALKEQLAEMTAALRAGKGGRA